MSQSLRIATRGSPLALWQANHVATLLRPLAAPLAVELILIETRGDQIRDRPLAQIGGDGLFTKEIQRAVLDGRADVAVHSLKDLPTETVSDLVLGAVPPRGATGDVLVSSRYRRFDALPPGAIVGTSSLRRRAQAIHRRPDLRLVDVRGNVGTRLERCASGELDALILAQAGLERLGLHERIAEIIDPKWMLPAVGQGALGLECRADDRSTQSLLRNLDDPNTHAAVLAERSLLRNLGGGCLVPIGTRCEVEETQLRLTGAVLAPDGSSRVQASASGIADRAAEIGQELAATLLRAGAGRMLEQRR